MQAKHSLRFIALHSNCPSCASGLLAANVSRGVGLGASDGVRMVWWGFRALKTPERASSLPTLQRRRAFGGHFKRKRSIGKQKESIWRAFRERKESIQKAKGKHMKFEEALEQLPIDKKARRLRLLWPLIEAKLTEGVSHAAVLELLNRNGFGLTEATYKNYVQRFRKLQRTVVPERPAGRTLTTPAITTSEASNRPATFDYDPRGIPDLLK
jgi:hypothetical protein